MLPIGEEPQVGLDRRHVWCCTNPNLALTDFQLYGLVTVVEGDALVPRDNRFMRPKLSVWEEVSA